MRLKLPPLKDRKGDIPQLVDFMLQELVQGGKSHIKQISSEAMSVLIKYDWPGNVRELENIIHRSAVIAQGDVILPKNLPKEIFDNTKPNDSTHKELQEFATPGFKEMEPIG